MRKILVLTALGEAATGVLVFMIPQAVVRLLFAADVNEAGTFIGRVAGISLIGSAWPAGLATKLFERFTGC